MLTEVTLGTRARCFAVLSLALLLLLASESFAAPITVPTTLPPGAQYRLAFVTFGGHTATSTNIADYDAFVQAEANTEPALSSISWQVIGTTETVLARDHTGTAPGNYPGVPIFRLDDVKLVDNYADLWDWSIDAPLSVDQHGVTLGATAVWTGTGSTGQATSPHQLGSPYGVGTGILNATDNSWIHFGYSVATAVPRRMYALSEVLVVPVPEPSPRPLLALGVAAFLLSRRVLRD
jgi:hypothetical protein